MVTSRRYNILVDFTKVFDFLVNTYDKKTLNSQLLPHYFEYAQHLQWFDYLSSHRIGIWEEDGEIVGISTYEMNVGQAHLHTKKEYEYLLPELLEWAERELYKKEDNERFLQILITDKEENKRELLKSKGYIKLYSDSITIFDYDNEFIQRELPDGFKMIDGTNVDFEKLTVCFAKGFDNADELEEPVTDKDINGNIKRFSSPSANPSLMRIVVAPNGEYASALGMWFDEVNKYAYLEPMATVPKYRRLGLGTTALMDSMKQTKELGATYCFGGPVEHYYPQIGFEEVAKKDTWQKRW